MNCKKIVLSIITCLAISTTSLLAYNAQAELSTLEKAKPGNWEYGKAVIAQKAAEYAVLTNDAYNSRGNGYGKNNELSGWVVVTSRHEDVSTGLTGGAENSKSGFDVTVYKKDDKYVIAFRGTEGTQDVLTDAQIALGGNNNQYNRALEFVENYRKYYLKDVPKDDIVLAGHSLGGGLAQAVGATLNLETYAFDAAPVPKEYILEHHNEIEANKNSSNQRQIVRISDQNDPLTLITSATEVGYLNKIEGKTINRDNFEHLSTNFIVYDFSSGTYGHSMEDLSKGLSTIGKIASIKGIGTDDSELKAALRLFSASSDDFVKKQYTNDQFNSYLAALSSLIVGKNVWDTLDDKYKQSTFYKVYNFFFSHGGEFDINELRNSINQELLQAIPSDTPYYAGEYSLSWGGNNSGSGSFETSPDGAAPKAGVSLVFQGGAISQTKLLTQSKATYFGDYNYVAWGTWDGTSVASDPGSGREGNPFKAFWVATELTTLNTQPKTGSATYNGEVQGLLSGTTPLGGNIALNANFGTNALTGTMNITKVSDGSTWRNTTFNTSIVTAGDGEHMQFATKLNGANIVNATNTYQDSKIMGSFAGPQAAEVGGVWNITATNGNVAVGAFRAKKQ